MFLLVLRSTYGRSLSANSETLEVEPSRNYADLSLWEADARKVAEMYINKHFFELRGPDSQLYMSEHIASRVSTT